MRVGMCASVIDCGLNTQQFYNYMLDFIFILMKARNQIQYTKNEVTCPLQINWYICPHTPVGNFMKLETEPTGDVRTCDFECYALSARSGILQLDIM
jgi:hypothetical protein